MPPQLQPTKRGFGCLGCLPRVVFMLLLGCALVMAIDAVFAPWSYYMGGRFHPIPYWTGWGRMHAAAGDYLLYVNMQPSPGGRGMPHIRGNAWLCTPRGEILKLTLGADFEKHMGASTDGKRVYLWLHKRPPIFFGSAGDTRPELKFQGFWHNPDMVLDDEGTINREFMADGRLYSGNLHHQPGAHNPLPITIKEGSYADFDAACKSGKMR